MPEFSLASPSEFEDVINAHDAFVSADLATWRRMVITHKSEIADLLLTYPDASRLSKPDIERLLANSAAGSASCFDPWNGRWQGIWHGGGDSPQHHFWDVTVQHGGQHIQPVTQSTHRLVDAAALATSFNARQVDLGLNAWKQGQGVTGYVIKYQDSSAGGAVKRLPHIGYLLDQHTLLWIAQERPVRDDYFMFFETADPGNGTYSIYGKSFEITGSGATATFKPNTDMLGRATYRRPRVETSGPSGSQDQ